jgi:hypothetical protein
MEFRIKDIVKDNKSHFSFYRSASVVTLKPANGGHGKTGQRR